MDEKTWEKKHITYVYFMDLEKVYDRFDIENMWQLTRMYNASDKLLRGINY